MLRTVPRPASMAARLVVSPAPSRHREPECASAEKEPRPKQRSLKEFGVICQSAPSSAEGLTAPIVEKRKYGVRGTCGTFAGKRPPKDEDKLKQFLQHRDEHNQKMQKTPKGRQATDAQQHYRDFVKAMLPHEMDGNGKERLKSVAAKWKKQAMPERLAQENKSVL